MLLSIKNVNLQQPSKKLAVKFLGPYKVLEVISNYKLAYCLELLQGTKLYNVFYVLSLKPFKGDLGIAVATILKLISKEEEPLYIVECIINYKHFSCNCCYLIK